MSEVWYTSDIHLGHRKVSEIRGFEDTDDHDHQIVMQWLKQVKPEDTVYVLGDVAVSGYGYALSILKQLPGTKHLISGNHDPVHPMHRAAYSKRFVEWLEVFETIQPFQRKRLNGVEFAMSHFPYAAWGDGPGREGSRYEQWRLPDLGMKLLHGHTHGPERDHANMLHVGWDAWGRLVRQSEVIEWLGAP